MPPSRSSLARAADTCCLALAIAAVIVAISGGFRVRIAGIRLGVTSPIPLLIWCALIAIVRHAAMPADPLYRTLPARIARLARLPAARASTAAFVGTRPVILLVGYFAVFMFGFLGGRAPLRHFDNELLNLPVRWDAGWYLSIVTDGYHYVPHRPELQQNIVFFPAYPMLTRALGRLLGGHLAGDVAAGMALSLGAFWGALVYLFAFARRHIGADKAAAALWLIAAYPFALFFGAIYTESLFLLATIATFYHVTERQYGRAALWGLLVGLTRLNGALLAVPLAILAVSRWLPPSLVRRQDPSLPAADDQPASVWRILSVAAMPVVGMLLYAGYIWRLTGEPLAFASGQVAWGRTYEGLGTLVSSQYAMIANTGLSGYVGAPGYDVVNALGAIFALAAIWPVARRLGLAYGVFLLINTVLPLGSGGLLSAGRFSSVLFPAFVWLADAVPDRHRAGWVASFAALQAFNAALFYTWRPLI